MEGLIFNPETAPEVKCILVDYKVVREEGMLIKKHKNWVNNTYGPNAKVR